MTGQPHKPSAWNYGLAVVVIFIGGVAGGWFLYNQLSGLTEGLQQVIVPGESEITLPEPGTYTIFHEYQSVIENRVYSNQEGVPGLKVALVPTSGESPVDLAPATVNSNYSLGARAGVSVLEFTIAQPGRYRVSAWYPRGHTGQESVLAIGHGFTAKLFGTIFGGIGIFLGSAAAGGAIAIRTFLRRR